MFVVHWEAQPPAKRNRSYLLFLQKDPKLSILFFQQKELVCSNVFDITSLECAGKHDDKD
jgi:hypothetical protein